MSDSKLPEPSNEFLSSRPQNLPKNMVMLIKNFEGRLRLARTLGALQTVKRDIEHSAVQQNFPSKEQLRAVANGRARELGHKEGRDWWS